MPMDLYISPTSPACHSVMQIIELLNLDVNLKKLDLQNKEQLSPEFLKVVRFSWFLT